MYLLPDPQRPSDAVDQRRLPLLTRSLTAPHASRQPPRPGTRPRRPSVTRPSGCRWTRSTQRCGTCLGCASSKFGNRYEEGNPYTAAVSVEKFVRDLKWRNRHVTVPATVSAMTVATLLPWGIYGQSQPSAPRLVVAAVATFVVIMVVAQILLTLLIQRRIRENLSDFSAQSLGGMLREILDRSSWQALIGIAMAIVTVRCFYTRYEISALACAGSYSLCAAVDEAVLYRQLKKGVSKP